MRREDVPRERVQGLAPQAGADGPGDVLGEVERGGNLAAAGDVAADLPAVHPPDDGGDEPAGPAQEV